MSVHQRQSGCPYSCAIDRRTAVCPACGRGLTEIIAWVDAQDEPQRDALAAFPAPMAYLLACLMQIS